MGLKRNKKEELEKPVEDYMFKPPKNVQEKSSSEIIREKSEEKYNIFERLFKYYYFKRGKENTGSFIGFRKLFKENDFMQW